MRVFLVIVFLLAFVRSLYATDPQQNVQDLRDLMTERLAVMEYVAAHKWNERLKIEDKQREERVLAETLARANVDGAEAVALTRALKAQMEAAKRVQSRLFEVWETVDKDRNSAAPDLQVSLRPRIGRLSNDLIATFLAVRDELDDCEAHEMLTPVPSQLADFPKAWALAVEGVLAAPDLCALPQD